ncbi:unnamed protein product [Soboliphyme baturini]|uniref:Retrovirus-related Pol polyprotein from transposon TNT 1-94 n=1 Tax=Soboliphyme baturini TaxID=241478 RepID=A0A183J120_9BILA|nr:unnamed protein product [Soboliphyme baturini]
MCKSVDGYGYFEELEKYRRDLTYVGRRVKDPTKGLVLHVLSGKIKREDKEELIELELDEKVTMVSLKRVALSRAKYAYLEYSYGENVKQERPDDRHFNLPPICSTQEVLVKKIIQ